MQNKNIIVRSLTFFTAILSYIFFRRLWQMQRQTNSKLLQHRENPELKLDHKEKILLESNVFSLQEAVSPSSTMDDFTRITGIGKKSENALHKAGITTFSHLSNLTQLEIETILNNAGIKIVKCEGWAKAAKTFMNISGVA